ncbi:tripartite tricarboxylate transporter TctB family protein [Nitrincola sp. MINF-07-Sa-05]|uniref:tripartite tricarboxylate transporter TctB family protein n=1 Tax=Nitrincola salilacus TaxID=3400273 RepID=UPI00391801E4
MTRINHNQVLAIILGLFSIVYLWMAFQIPTFPIPRPVDSDAFPKALGAAILILSVFLFLEKTGEKGVEVEETSHIGFSFTSPYMQVVVTSVGVLAYAFLIEPLGFVLASSLLMFLLATYYGYRAWLVNLATTLGIVLSLYFVMTRAVGVHLPPGILPF